MWALAPARHGWGVTSLLKAGRMPVGAISTWAGRPWPPPEGAQNPAASPRSPAGGIGTPTQHTNL